MSITYSIRGGTRYSDTHYSDTRYSDTVELAFNAHIIDITHPNPSFGGMVPLVSE